MSDPPELGSDPLVWTGGGLNGANPTLLQAGRPVARSYWADSPDIEWRFKVQEREFAYHVFQRAAICLLVLAACGDEDAGTQAAADVPLNPPQADIRFEVGSLDGPGLTFGDRIFLDFDAAGNLHVLDASNSRTMVLNEAGGVRWVYERTGRGPGEFMYPVGLGVRSDGGQVVADLGNRKLVVLNGEGEFERAVPVDAAHGFPSGVMSILGREAFSRPSSDYGLSAPSDTVLFGVRAYSTEAPTVRIVAEAWRAQDPRPPTERLDLGRSSVRVRASGLTDLKAFWPAVHLARVGGAVALVDSTDYRIEVIDPEGLPVRALGRGLSPHPTTPAAEAAERKRRLDALDRGEGPRFQISTSDGKVQNVDPEQLKTFLSAEIEAMTFWPEIPAIHSVLGAPDGTLWVRRSDGDGSPGMIDIHSGTGEYLGTLAAGSAFPAALGPDGLAAYTETDPLGVPLIRVASLRFGPS